MPKRDSFYKMRRKRNVLGGRIHILVVVVVVVVVTIVTIHSRIQKSFINLKTVTAQISVQVREKEGKSFIFFLGSYLINVGNKC